MSLIEASSRDRIRTAAVEQLKLNGLIGMRMFDVAAAADVSVPLIYKLFRDRNGLLTDVLSELYASYVKEDIASIRNLISLTSGPISTKVIANNIVPISQPRRHERRWIRVQIVAASVEIKELHERLRIEHASLIQQTVQLAVEIRQRNGATRPVNLHFFATILFALVFGLVLSDLDLDELDTDAYRHYMEELLSTYLEP